MPIIDRRQRGFTIVELAFVVVIIGAVAGLAVPTYLGYLDKARLARCIAEIRYISRAIDAYHATEDAFPNDLAEAGAGDIIDPWGNAYEYLNIAALNLSGKGGGNGGGNGNGGGGNGGGGNGGGNGGGGNGAGSGGSGNSSTTPTPGGSGNGGGNGNGGGKGKNGAWQWILPDEAYAGGNTNGKGNGSGNASKGKPRKERFLHPINSDYDLYSMGKDGESVEPLTAKKSHDDVIRANDGGFVGLAVEF